MSIDLLQALVGLSAFIVPSLLSMNIWFIRRLISQLDGIAKVQHHQDIKISIVSNDVASISHSFDEARDEIKALQRLDTEVQILKAQFNN